LHIRHAVAVLRGYNMSPATQRLARDLAIQHIGYWRTAKMPGTRAYSRRYALALLRMIRTGVIE
jgi:hypothetical protein